MGSFTPLIKQNLKADSKKIKIRIYKFWGGSKREFGGGVSLLGNRERNTF
jgi:hypothetical protein